MVSANDKVIVEMHLSGGNCHDAPQGRISIENIGDSYSGIPYLMDRAYEGDKTRALRSEERTQTGCPTKEKSHKSVGI